MVITKNLQCCRIWSNSIISKLKISILSFEFLFYLFLKGTWHQSPELWQAVVDPVSASLLYNLRKRGTKTTRTVRKHPGDDHDMEARIERNSFKEEKNGAWKNQSTSLTPLLFLRAKIWEELPGDMDPVTGLYGQADRTDRQIETETERQEQRWDGV